jgi:carboxymethylenebutenolidase
MDKGSFIELSVGDCSLMHAYISMPAKVNTRFPALMLFQEAFGVNHHIRNLADRFAEEGFIVIAPELFHRTAHFGFEGNYNDFDAIAPHFKALTETELEADILATWDYLQQNPLVLHDKIASIGYCMGGRVSFLANTVVPLKAAVSYYGSRIVPDLIKRASMLNGPMLFFWGGLDKHISTDVVFGVTDGLDKARKPYISKFIPDADHGFFNDERASYNEHAAKESWAMTLTFLNENLED